MQPGLAAPASVPLAPFTHGLLLVAPAAAEHSFTPTADAHGSGGGESTGEKPHTHRTRHRAMCRLAAEPSSQLSSHLILSVTRGTPLPLTDQDCCAV